MFVNERFSLDPHFKEDLKNRTPKWGFGLLSETAYYRTYSRPIPSEGRQEQWADTVIRVTEGVFSIYKDAITRVGKPFDETRWQEFAQGLANAMFQFHFLPPGRGLWQMGTEYMYQRGSHALNNCGFISVGQYLSDSADWLMDSLMLGVGVGFDTHRADLNLIEAPNESFTATYVIPDSREGWVESVARLIQDYEFGSRTRFDYSKIRPKGSPIRGFGGIASGPAPLIQLHDQLRSYLNAYVLGQTSDSRLIADVMNAIGACVVSGNVRRSAEISLGRHTDEDFLNLKSYEHNPERMKIGAMSNNSVMLEQPSDYENAIPIVADLVQTRGEPGLVNLMNVQQYARYGEESADEAIGINPCGEIPLESSELCNLSEVFPTRCDTFKEFELAVLFASFYSSVVSLLPSHRPETQAVIEKNHRIGVSMSGIAEWGDAIGYDKLCKILDTQYAEVQRVNQHVLNYVGVQPSNRLTTVKPSGTVSTLAGVSSGMHHPEGGTVLRRMRVGDDSPVIPYLERAGVPMEPDQISANTVVCEFPLQYTNKNVRSIRDVSLQEQVNLVKRLGAYWADNAVSNTLKYQPGFEHEIEPALMQGAPFVKSLSLLPDIDEGAYPQMPFERISEREFAERDAAIQPITWSAFAGSLAEKELASSYCDGEYCEI